jgi:2-C-methyl-D-erythritol 4-phosphate cytidylyltransferase
LIHQAVIVAGGKGERFGTDIPKQFLRLRSKPVLSWSIEAFLPLVEDLVVVLPEDQINSWLDLTGEKNGKTSYNITNGGRTRSESVMNGLNALPVKEDALIAVHDAARPLVNQKFILALYKSCEEHGSAIPVTAMRDSLRMIINSGRSESVDRSKIVAVQTPQIFNANVLRSAYSSAVSGSFTDDASLVEAAGTDVYLTEGDPWNIKLTYPDDFVVAESLIIR